MDKPSNIPALSEFPTVPDRNDPPTYADRSEVWDQHQKDTMEPELNEISQAINLAVSFVDEMQQLIWTRYSGIDSDTAALRSNLDGLMIALNAAQSSINLHAARLTTIESFSDGIDSRQAAVETLLQDNLPELDIAAAEQKETDQVSVSIASMQRHINQRQQIDDLAEQVRVIKNAINYLSKSVLNRNLIGD